MNSLARGQHGQRPARQQLEVPAHDRAGEHQQAVDERVQQRAEAAVLAGHAGGDAVEVVAPARSTAKQDRRRARSRRRSELKREHEEDRDQREPDEADRVRDRPRVQRLRRGASRGGGGPERSSPDEPPEASARSRVRSHGRRRATAPPPPRAAPSSGQRRAVSLAAPHLRLDARRPRARACRPSAAAGSRAARRRRTSRPGRASRSS